MVRDIPAPMYPAGLNSRTGQQSHVFYHKNRKVFRNYQKYGKFPYPRLYSELYTWPLTESPIFVGDHSIPLIMTDKACRASALLRSYYSALSSELHLKSDLFSSLDHQFWVVGRLLCTPLNFELWNQYHQTNIDIHYRHSNIAESRNFTDSLWQCLLEGDHFLAPFLRNDIKSYSKIYQSCLSAFFTFALGPINHLVLRVVAQQILRRR